MAITLAIFIVWILSVVNFGKQQCAAVSRTIQNFFLPLDFSFSVETTSVKYIEDNILIPQYAFTEPVVIAEGTQPGIRLRLRYHFYRMQFLLISYVTGTLLVTLRAKASNGKTLEFQCYVSGFLCNSKKLLTTIYETVYELKISSNQTYEQVIYSM